MKLTLGFSPCPNDTFIFDALINNKIDTQGLTFEVVTEDVQTLNKMAIGGKLDISKISYGVLPLVMHHYKVLNSGGALGMGVGPLLISRSPLAPVDTIQNKTIAIPGQNTTAHMLFSLAYPHATNKKWMVFNQIEDAVLSGAADVGVIIHENRFTYQDKGLISLMDLGSYWEQQTGLPIPLGGIVVHTRVPAGLHQLIDQLIARSLQYSFDHYPVISPYVCSLSQEMDEQVMRQHIDLYVNQFSLHLGQQGRQAVFKMLEVWANINQQQLVTSHNLFID